MGWLLLFNGGLCRRKPLDNEGECVGLSYQDKRTSYAHIPKFRETLGKQKCNVYIVKISLILESETA